jgi:hypothetical protein
MSRIIPEPTYNKYRDLMLEVNDFMISVKLNQINPQLHKLPTNEDCDKIQQRLQEMFNEFEQPMRVRR